MSSFNTALSALKANATALDVVGNNLANLNSTGFKASTVAFAELASQALGSAVSTASDGAGVSQPTAIRQFTQGAVQVTGGPLNAAIQGDGFFMVRDTDGRTLYTRDGNFRLDAGGNLLNIAGQNVQGWVSSAGVLNPSGPVSNIVVSTGTTSQPVVSTLFSVAMNLNASAATGQPDGTFSTPVQVVDSLGARHTLTVTFTKTNANAWDYDITIPGEDVGAPGTPTSLATGSIEFDPDGLLTSPAPGTPVNFAIAGLANGAADMDLNWSLHNTAEQGLLTQYALPSSVSAVDQDGRPAASLIRVGISDGGQVVGQYSDGRQEVVAQLALAYFRNPDTLRSAGSNNLAATAESSAPAVGLPGSGSRGAILGGALESSTADIAREFTSLIVYQRGYQANSRVVTTVDELTQETLNLIR